MALMTCDNDCTQAGWVEYLVDFGVMEAHLSCPPDADLDGEFVAFDHDNQEPFLVSGWLGTFERVTA